MCSPTATWMPGFISSAEHHLLYRATTLDYSILSPLPADRKYFEVKATCLMKYLHRY